MKKILLLTILILFFSMPTFAGSSSDMQQFPQQIVLMPTETSHWYYEMIVASGGLILAGIGLWLKYKRRK